MEERCELDVLRIAQEALNNTRRHAKASAVRVSLAYGDAGVRIQVSDDGVGFDISAVHGMLSPTSGGFGLTSMRERARLVGGHIEIISTPGKGTQVDAQIPYQTGLVATPHPTRATKPLAVAKEAEQDDIRVLIVDDHAVVRAGLRNMLEQAGGVVVVGEAADGEAATERVSALAPDVVLMDIQMPKMDGVETLRRLREQGLKPNVILLSVFAKDEYIFDGLRAGARGYLLKDVGRDELVQAISTVYQGGSLLQPMVANRLIERLDSPEHPCLTEREREILSQLDSGARNKEIAEELFLSVNTVKFHIDNVYQKLGVKTRTQAVRAARECGILSA